jgi:YhcH/YjgK/YiaL family protein
MVVTDLRHVDSQAAMTAGLRKAVDFLGRRDLMSLSDGREEIDGERVFALVQRYETARVDEPRFECHRKYIDVQFMVSGEEVIGWAPAGNMTVTEAYDAGKDICFGTVAEGQWVPVRLEAGQLMVLRPEDAHAPKGAAGGPSKVMKIVVKVAM